MLFIREIKYFDYMESGFKMGHVGHARIELWEKDGVLLYDAEDGEIHIKLSNLPGNAVGSAMVQLITMQNNYTIGEINLTGGGGSFVYAQSKLTEEIDRNLAYNQILGIKIDLGPQKEAVCKIHELSHSISENENRKEIELEVADEMIAELPDGEEQVLQMAEDIVYKGDVCAQEVAPMGEDKWSHLCNIYPRVTPFSDEREYLQIGPGDFVLLSSKYYTLINNSFMLHGYYHYGQLVLCKVEKRGKTMYYLGTPGIYLEREKQVAIMYGFESFECASEPATEGDFGYYMVQVEL